MINLNSYIIEKLKIDKDIRINDYDYSNRDFDLEKKTVAKLKKHGEHIWLDEIFNNIITYKSYKIDYIYAEENDTRIVCIFAYKGNKTGKLITPIHHIFNSQQIKQIYDYLK